MMLVVTLLAIGFIATRLSEWLKLPHSVFLVVLGLVAGWGIRSLNRQLIEPLTSPLKEGSCAVRDTIWEMMERGSKGEI